MTQTAKSPAAGDSDNVLLWKAMLNLWILSEYAGASTPIPKLGSSDTVLLTRGLQAVLAFE